MARFIVFISSILFASCSNSERYYDKLCIQDSLTAFNRVVEISKNNYNIITHIDLSCTVCWDELFMWNDFINDSINSINTSLYCFVYTTNRIITEKKLYNIADLSTKCFIIFDEQSEYLKKNKEVIKKYRTVSFVTDSTMNIILHGAPFYDKELMERYSSLLK